MADVKPGQAVRVFDVNPARTGQPPGGWPAEVVDASQGQIMVRLTGRQGRPAVVPVSADGSGDRYLRTMAEVEEMEREGAALAVLENNGVTLIRRLPLPKIEALAGFVGSWED